MSDSFIAGNFRAFTEILFVRFDSENIRRLNIVNRIILYIFAAALYYAPIMYFLVYCCTLSLDALLYFAVMAALHTLSRIMLCNSKKIRKKFSTLKTKRHFIKRTLLILEYIVFMWVVFLFYPITCILFPLSLLGMSVEHMLGSNGLYTLFINHSEHYILIGGMISYIIFIVADSYRNMKTGLFPEYLRLYAMLTVIAGSMEQGMTRLTEAISLDISGATSMISRFFAISNDSMKLVSSAMTLFFVAASLYKDSGNKEDGGESEIKQPYKEKRAEEEAEPAPENEIKEEMLSEDEKIVETDKV